MNAKVTKIVNNNEISKSQKIRLLYGIGISKSEIGKLLGIRYQFVRNVLVREFEKNNKNKEVISE